MRQLLFLIFLSLRSTKPSTAPLSGLNAKNSIFGYTETALIESGLFYICPEIEVWTGDYIFDNEWQSFRTKKNRNLELTSASKVVQKGTYKVAVKVVDIFGNDTTKVIEVKI